MGNAWGAGWHILVGQLVATVLVLVRSLAVLVDGGVVRSTWGVVLASIDVLRSISGNVGFGGGLLYARMAWCKVSCDLLMSGVLNCLTVRVHNGMYGLGIVDGLRWVIVVFSSITLHSKES